MKLRHLLYLSASLLRSPPPASRRACLIAVLLLIAQQTHAAQDPKVAEAVKPAQPKLSIPADGASVPMLDFGGRPVVEVRINGKGPFPFILDTGASRTVVDFGLSDELSLPRSASDTTIKQLQVGEVSLGDLSVRAGPISTMLGGTNPPRGVLSALSFPGYLLTFDYPGKRIALRKGALKTSDGKTVFSYGADEELPTVPVKVAGRDIQVHLDTGAPFSLSLPTKYKDEVPLAGPLEEGHKARSHSGEFPVFKGTLAGEIEIGDHKLLSRDILFTDVVPHPGATPRGQMGYAALRHFAVTLDSSNRRIEFAKVVAAAP